MNGGIKRTKHIPKCGDTNIFALTEYAPMIRFGGRKTSKIRKRFFNDFRTANDESVNGVPGQGLWGSKQR